jgi:serine/threonine-protein kinase
MNCPSCSAPLPDDARFCPGCGAPSITTGDAPPDDTHTVPGGGDGTNPSAAFTSPADAGRFQTGTILADRYRIVGLLGRGGMGEVYRADDLKLGRTVAMKFLPEALERDPGRVVRFFNEVRTALQVTHPNVCRVYDIGETAGHHFLSMEYVDGEDLATLLRRIGRLPEDRAVQVSRQLCAGLAAAHAQGVLHRDLKPANVMIDGRGEVKITDFGLAGAAGDFEGDEIRVGTPAYMAPEQIEGKEVSVRSDLYALGLVLYEVFSGKPAYEGRTPEEIARRSETTPTSLSSLVGGLDPAVAKVVERCLEADPEERPASAAAIAAALPGGDPLAAALAAGETPSPEMLAEAGASAGLRPGMAVALVAATLALVAVSAFLSPRTVLVSRVSLDLSPAVLSNKSAELIREAGWGENTQESLHAWEPNWPYYQHVLHEGVGAERWEEFGDPRPPGILHLYRESPKPLVRLDEGSIGNWMIDPSPTVPGMVGVTLDPDGRLMSFYAVPARFETAPEEGPGAVVYDFAPFFAAAGLDPATLEAVEPRRRPETFADRRYAWKTRYADSPEAEIVVEAASVEGRPVSFRIMEPWDRPYVEDPTPPGFWARAGGIVSMVWYVAVLIAASLLAIRNVRFGRGDFRTGFRFAIYLSVARLAWMVAANHHPGEAAMALIPAQIAWAAYRFVLVFVFYLALEPYARRLWPEMLVSWVRFFDNRFTDPRVGRDLLIGVAAGCFLGVSQQLAIWTPQLLGIPDYGLSTGFWGWESLRGPGSALGLLVGVHVFAVLENFIGLMLFLVLRLVTRRTWIALPIVTVLAALNFGPGIGSPWPYLVALVVNLALWWFVLFRAGILPSMIMWSIGGLLNIVRVTPDVTAWHALPMWLVWGTLAAVTVWGFRAAVAGRPIFRDEIQEG